MSKIKTTLNDLMNGRFSGGYACDKSSVVIECYQYVRSIYRKTMISSFIALIVSLSVMVIAGFYKLFHPGLAILGFIVLGGIPIISYLVKKMASIECPLCHHQKTYYFLVKENNFNLLEESKLEIECRNCHHRFETDCKFPLLGIFPQKRLGIHQETTPEPKDGM